MKIGDKYGAWTIIDQPTKSARATVLCRCDCGTERTVSAGHVKRGASTSCGCSRRKSLKHGGASHGKLTPEYQSWRAMRERCTNPNGEHWHLYGGRGIKIYARWESYSAFLADMGPKPTPRHTIERINSNGDYEPGNCRWATQKEQCRNFSRNRLLTFRGETLTLAEWSERVGISYSALNCRVHKGWPVEKALTRPVGRWPKAVPRFEELMPC